MVCQVRLPAGREVQPTASQAGSAPRTAALVNGGSAAASSVARTGREKSPRRRGTWPRSLTPEAGEPVWRQPAWWARPRPEYGRIGAPYTRATLDLQGGTARAGRGSRASRAGAVLHRDRSPRVGHHARAADYTDWQVEVAHPTPAGSLVSDGVVLLHDGSHAFVEIDRTMSYARLLAKLERYDAPALRAPTGRKPTPGRRWSVPSRRCCSSSPPLSAARPRQRGRPTSTTAPGRTGGSPWQPRPCPCSPHAGPTGRCGGSSATVRTVGPWPRCRRRSEHDGPAPPGPVSGRAFQSAASTIGARSAPGSGRVDDRRTESSGRSQPDRAPRYGRSVYRSIFHSVIR